MSSYTSPTYYTSGNYKIRDTIASGQALIASLTGQEILELQYDSAINGISPYIANSSASVNYPSVDWLLQGLVRPVPMAHGYSTFTSTDTSATGYIMIGSDTSSVASNYLQLFNITSTNQTRLVQVIACDNDQGAVYLTNGCTTSSSVQIADNVGLVASEQLLLSSGNIGHISYIIVDGIPKSSGVAPVIKFQIIPT